jgi:hypothetical protein
MLHFATYSKIRKVSFGGSGIHTCRSAAVAFFCLFTMRLFIMRLFAVRLFAVRWFRNGSCLIWRLYATIEKFSSSREVLTSASCPPCCHLSLRSSRPSEKFPFAFAHFRINSSPSTSTRWRRSAAVAAVAATRTRTSSLRRRSTRTCPRSPHSF